MSSSGSRYNTSRQVHMRRVEYTDSCVWISTGLEDQKRGPFDASVYYTMIMY